MIHWENEQYKRMKNRFRKSFKSFERKLNVGASTKYFININDAYTKGKLLVEISGGDDFPVYLCWFDITNNVRSTKCKLREVLKANQPLDSLW